MKTEKTLDISPIQRECPKCGKTYNPRWLHLLNKYAGVCGTCAMANLEKFMSEDDEADEPAPKPACTVEEER